MRRDERVLYIRKCSGTDKRIISFYDEFVSFPVYSREYWYGDSWDGTIYGRDYDFNKSFFHQFIELAKVAPRLQLWQVNAVNSEYSNYIVDSKNCYLCFTALGGNEDCMYSSYLTDSINSIDSDQIAKCERCYQCFNCDTCYNCRYSVDSMNCIDSWFLRACNNCSDCFGCVNLTGKQYHIFNEAHTKEEYNKKLSEFQLTSRKNIPYFSDKADKLWAKFPRRYMHGKKNEQVTGDYVTNSGKSKNLWFSKDCENCKNLFFVTNAKDSMDVTASVVSNELLYECHAVPKQNYDVKFSELCSSGCSYLEYCSNCDSSSYLFGCIGLRKKEYCIFNKQYTKEEYEVLVPKIKKHMDEMSYADKGGRIYKYGEFLPPESCVFAYNESLAQEFFPLTKNEAEKKGFTWKELKEKNYNITIFPLNAPEDVSAIQDDIISEVIGCMNEGEGNHNCTTAFRILPDELQFYRLVKLPLPVFCPNCRHQERLKHRNTLNLWHRKCDCAGASSSNSVYKNTGIHIHGNEKCENIFETSFSPDQPEIVYCEKCYQQEVY